jgi:hypothetical protein
MSATLALTALADEVDSDYLSERSSAVAEARLSSSTRIGTLLLDDQRAMRIGSGEQSQDRRDLFTD